MTEEVPMFSPVSDGFDLPFYNGYAVDVAALLAVYALMYVFAILRSLRPPETRPSRLLTLLGY